MGERVILNKEILFKAKRKDNGEWVEGYYVYCRKRHYILPLLNEAIGYDEREDEWIEIEPDTICLFTGLSDKNGKKIWENDIVCVTHEKYQERDEMEVQPFFPEPKSYKRNYHVEFVNSGCCYGCRVRNKSIHFMLNRNVIFNHKVEAIGNVFDNPELLEVE